MRCELARAAYDKNYNPSCCLLNKASFLLLLETDAKMGLECVSAEESPI